MSGSLLVAWFCCVVSVVFYGTNFLPVKRIDAGDGIFFGWCMALGIWLTGLIADHTSLTTAGHRFEPACMLGGALWATGNVAGPLIIKHIGIGMALSVWGLTNMLTGWATGNFGLFGVAKTPASNPTLNYVGVGLALLAGVAFGLVRPEMASDPEPLLEDPGNPVKVVRKRSSLNSGISGSFTETVDLERKAGTSKYYIAFAGALVAGVFFGSTFDMMQILQQGAPENGHSTNAFDYNFSNASGILALYSCVMAIYIVAMGGQAYVPRGIILPALVSGAMWMVAFIAWSQANSVLSLAISFPIIVTGPSLVSLSIGVFVFQEFKETRNLLLILGASVLTIIGVVVIARSK